MRLTSLRRHANKPRYGPPKPSAVPKGCPSPTATSAPSAPGRPQQARRDGVEAHDKAGAETVGDATSGSDVLQAAEEVRSGDDDRPEGPLVDDRVPGRHAARTTATVSISLPEPRENVSSCRRQWGWTPCEHSTRLLTRRRQRRGSPPRRATPHRHRARRSRHRGRSAGRSSSGTRRWPAERPGTPPADRACKRSRTPSGTRWPSRRPVSRGRRNLPRQSTRGLGRRADCGRRGRRGARRRPARSSPAADRGHLRSRRASGISPNSPSRSSRPRKPSISAISASVCATNGALKIQPLPTVNRWNGGLTTIAGTGPPRISISTLAPVAVPGGRNASAIPRCSTGEKLPLVTTPETSPSTRTASPLRGGLRPSASKTAQAAPSPAVRSRSKASRPRKGPCPS